MKINNNKEASKGFLKQKLKLQEVSTNWSFFVGIDDLINTKDAEALVGGFDWFSRGHLIILTSRNRQVLVQCDLCHSFVSGLNFIRATTVTETDKRRQNLPSVQRRVVDSKTFRAATFAKMYKLLQNLPSSVQIQGKLNSHAAP